MKLANVNQVRLRQRITTLLRRSWQENKALTLIGLFSVALLLVALLGLLLDPRTILNEPAWRKPAKFAISFILYSFTLLWLLSFIQRKRWLVGIISWVTAVTAFAELAIISYQAFRGVRSHFNYSTPLDETLFSLMGGFITLLGVMTLLALILLVRQRFSNTAFGLALKWGLLIGFVGAMLGATMTAPTAEQRQQLGHSDAGRYLGAHAVGVPDGGEGLPLIGWSTEGGDLRIPHFIGLHGMQVLPLLGWFIVRQQRFSPQQQRWLVWTAAFGYSGLVGLTLWQAIRGQPLIYPDGLTLAAFAGLLAFLFLPTVLIIRSPKRNQATANASPVAQ